MFEAKLLDGSILKRIVEAIKDVVADVNIDVSQTGKLDPYQLPRILILSFNRPITLSDGRIPRGASLLEPQLGRIRALPSGHTHGPWYQRRYSGEGHEVS